MRVLDLFSGLGGWSGPFREAGHDVFTVDIEQRFHPDLCADILEVSAGMLAQMGGPFDVVLASPPCETFSVASIGTHWGGGDRAYIPRTPEAERGMRIVRRTVGLIQELEPSVAVIENPRGVLRNLHLIPGELVTVWYCRYGETRAKPTDLWGLPFPPTWRPRPQCHNRRPGHPVACSCRQHEAAPRGAKTGTQGIGGAAGRALVPRQLAEDIMKASEAGMVPVPT